MNKKVIRSTILLIVAIYCFLIPANIAKANTTANEEVRILLNDFFKGEEAIRNDIYLYGENVFVNVNKNKDNKDTINYLKYILLKINNYEKDIDIYIDKYKDNSVDGRYLSATKVVLGYYRNAVLELLLYIDETKDENRFAALDRYFYNRLTGKNTADWLKVITANYQ